MTLPYCTKTSLLVTGTSGKRNKVVLNIDKKLAILERMSNCESATRLREEMGVEKSTISDFKKAGPKLGLQSAWSCHAVHLSRKP